MQRLGLMCTVIEAKRSTTTPLRVSEYKGSEAQAYLFKDAHRLPRQLVLS